LGHDLISFHSFTDHAKGFLINRGKHQQILFGCKHFLFRVFAEVIIGTYAPELAYGWKRIRDSEGRRDGYA